MRTSIGSAMSLILALTAVPAFAEDDKEVKAITLSGTATVVSDYRFRGISQTNKRPAVQASITATHVSGVYVGVWGSSVDEYIAAGADQEIDLIGGFKKSFGGTTVDVGAVYYYYPGAEQIVPGYNSDFVEPYASLAYTFGPVTAKATANYAPKQSALDYGLGKEDNFYASAELSGGIPNTPVTVAAKVGRNFTRSFLSSGTKYTDWSVSATYVAGALSIGVSYIDTNRNLFSGIPGANRNISKGGAFGTLGVSF